MTAWLDVTATTDERSVRKMFGTASDALIGVPTGHRFDVLDVDLPPDEARLWVRKSGLPITRIHTTRRGGLRWPRKLTLGSTRSKS